MGTPRFPGRGTQANHGFNMVQFTGKFTRTSEENYNEFLKALNVSYILRKAATSSTPVMEISESDGNWVMKTSTSLKAIELKFKMGVPFEENDRRQEVRNDGHHGGKQADHQPESPQ